MSLDPIPVTEVPLKRKLTKSRLQRGDSASSTYTTASESSRDMATQTNEEPTTATARSDQINVARMSGGASSDKSVKFDSTPPSVAYPARRESASPEAEAELVHDKKDKAPKRPSFKRNLSSLWKLLDPPELTHNTGVLHNLVKAEDDGHRRKKSADDTTLVETISSKQYKQR